MYIHKHTSVISIECVRLLCAALLATSAEISCAIWNQCACVGVRSCICILCLCKMAHMRIIESQYQFQYIDLSHFLHKFLLRNGMIELTHFNTSAHIASGKRHSGLRHGKQSVCTVHGVARKWVKVLTMKIPEIPCVNTRMCVRALSLLLFLFQLWFTRYSWRIVPFVCVWVCLQLEWLILMPHKFTYLLGLP